MLCSDCHRPITVQSKSGLCRSCAKKGSRNPYWNGGTRTNAATLRKWFPLDGVTCEVEFCDDPATDRHHIDGDYSNSVRENLLFLCRWHHMDVDGRLDELVRRNRAL